MNWEAFENCFLKGKPGYYLKIKKIKAAVFLCVGSMGGEAKNSNCPIVLACEESK